MLLHRNIPAVLQLGNRFHCTVQLRVGGLVGVNVALLCPQSHHADQARLASAYRMHGHPACSVFLPSHRPPSKPSLIHTTVIRDSCRPEYRDKRHAPLWLPLAMLAVTAFDSPIWLRSDFTVPSVSVMTNGAVARLLSRQHADRLPCYVFERSVSLTRSVFAVSKSVRLCNHP